jgi:hypothetical protein
VGLRGAASSGVQHVCALFLATDMDADVSCGARYGTLAHAHRPVHTQRQPRDARGDYPHLHRCARRPGVALGDLVWRSPTADEHVTQRLGTADDSRRFGVMPLPLKAWCPPISAVRNEAVADMLWEEEVLRKRRAPAIRLRRPCVDGASYTIFRGRNRTTLAGRSDPTSSASSSSSRVNSS